MITKDDIENHLDEAFDLVENTNKIDFKDKIDSLADKYGNYSNAGSFIMMVGSIKKIYPNLFKTILNASREDKIHYLFIISVGWECRSIYQIFVNEMKKAQNEWAKNQTKTN